MHVSLLFFIKKRRLKQSNIAKQKKILDLGCGEGYDMTILRRLGYLNIIGIDNSYQMLKIAKINNPNNSFKLGSAYKIPFPKESFDFVLVDGVFHHLNNYTKAIKEIERILRKNGILYFIEPKPHFIRKFIDILTISRLGLFIPLLKERRKYFLKDEILMPHWLKGVNEFLNILEKNKMKKIFVKSDLLSIIGKYAKDGD